jgi:NADH-quinone oxidoreductase subunit A
MTPQTWYMIAYFAAVIAVTSLMIGVSYVLGQRHNERATGEPYESGIVSTGSARLRFSAKFYLVAMFFVIFDLESVFLFSWAVAFRELGWAGYIAALVFIAVLIAVLVYEWRMGALDWGTARRVDRQPCLQPRIDTDAHGFGSEERRMDCGEPRH